MNRKILVGKKGESYVCEYLKQNGWSITQTNYHSRYGEIDIIAEDKNYIAFVEVKARNNFKFSHAPEIVNKSKRIKIIKTAYVYISEKNLSKQPRFDIAEVLISKEGDIKNLQYYKNSFDAEEYNAFF